MITKIEQQSPLAKIIEALHEENTILVSEIVNEFAPGEIARILESLPINDRDDIWRVVDRTLRPEVLSHLGEDALHEILGETPLNELLSYCEYMIDDDLVDFMQMLPDNLFLSVLQSLDGKQRSKLVQMLEYDEDSAGGMMSSDTITIRPDVSVGAVIRYLKMIEDLPHTTNRLFVVDRKSYLLGEISLSRLIVLDPSDQIADVMNTDFTAFNVNDDSHSITVEFREKDLVSAAVINDYGQLVGRITVDDVIDVMQDEAERTLLQSAGLDEETDTFAPIKQAALNRGFWLGINLITALIAASVINAFGATIEKVVALAALSPLIASMGGIAGSQSLTIIIRGIAIGQIEGANAKILLWRELAIGIINGLFWGAVTALISYLWFGQMYLALIVVAAIFVNLFFAALSGVAIPLLLKKLNIDPALAGSVILTTVTDVIGFVALLGLSALIL